jgi:N-acetyl-alpha-D-muramate 1-phosphate uridylyltransferase
MKAMLLAAGLGTRLKPFTDTAPKALAVVNGRTLLEHNIRFLQRFGIRDVVVNVHHFADMIEDAIAGNNGFGSNVSISDERDEVLETGGGLKKAAPFFDKQEAFVVMNVDVLSNIDINKLIGAHLAGNAIATLAVMDRASSRHFLFDERMKLCGWANNNTGERKISIDRPGLRPLAFSGIQVLSSAVFNDIPFSGKFSLVDLYLHLAKQHTILGYDHSGDLFIDVGKPESLAKASLLFQ